MHGIVAQELLAGALDAQGLRILRKSYIEPFERRNRLVVPDFATWKHTGEVISRMCQRNLVSRGGLKHSFVRVVVLAVSCRRFGHTLITGNASDFERITKVEPFDFIPPYPEG